MRLLPGTPIEVVWVDTYTRLLDVDWKNYKAGYVTTDIGYYLGEKDDCIVLSLAKGDENREEGNCYCGTTDIPLGTVKEIHVLRRKGAYKKRVARKDAGDCRGKNRA